MSGRPALDINKLMEARPFSTNHSSLSRRWSLRSLYTCYVSFKEIDSLPRIGESVSSSFPRYVLHQQIHCYYTNINIWGSLLLQCNSGRPCYCNANATALHPCYCSASASLLLQMLLHCIPATALHPCYCTALLQM